MLQRPKTHISHPRIVRWSGYLLIATFCIAVVWALATN
jgi:hypothetical protein